MTAPSDRSTSLRAKAAIRSLAQRRYGSARIHYRSKLRRQTSDDPILIYTMGKVGSTSVAAALNASGSSRPIHQIHWLTDSRLSDADRHHRDGARRHRGTYKSERFYQRHVWLGQHFQRKIAEQERVWTVITLVRDPVARNVSGFFQNLERLFDYWPAERLAQCDAEEVASELVDLFLETYVMRSAEAAQDGDPLVWFDEELRTVFDIDVYASPFPREIGYATYSSRSARLLLMRLDDLDRVAPEALGSFLGLPDVNMGRSNDASDKTYAEVYRHFRELLVMPDEYLDMMYGSQFATHFFTENEIADFRAVW